MALIIAGDRSGVGKTTITLAILAFLARRGKKVQSFKVGPDYIDPMFHSAVTNIPCRNLDPVLTSADYVRQCFQRHAGDADYVLVEGVMGLFDGVYHPDRSETLNDYGSTAHISRILKLPVALVLDCSSLSSSIAAIAYGYANLDPEVQVAGVILNKVASQRHLELLETALKAIGMPILGVLKRDRQVSIPDRHLGLIPSNEIAKIDLVFTRLADLARVSFNWDKLEPLLTATVSQQSITPITYSDRLKVRIAVAQDAAFNFYYQDNLDILRELGAELIFWSPIEDKGVPNKIQGLYFGGGFPEVFAQQLAAHKRVLERLRQIIQAGMPTYAECGGLMYLCQKLIDLKQQSWSMVGAIPQSVSMEAKLTLGYRTAIALNDSCAIAAKQKVMGHEFHRSQVQISCDRPVWQLKGLHQSSLQLTEGWQEKQLHASYLHLHWGENRHLARRFVNYCQNYKTSLY